MSIGLRNFQLAVYAVCTILIHHLCHCGSVNMFVYTIVEIHITVMQNTIFLSSAIMV